MRRLDTVEELNNRLRAEIKMINKTIKCLSSQDCKDALLQWCSRAAPAGADGLPTLAGIANTVEDVMEDPKLADQKVYAEVDFDVWDLAEEDYEFNDNWPAVADEAEAPPSATSRIEELCR